MVIDESLAEFTETQQTSLEVLTIDDPIVKEIKHLDLERTTPMDALIRLKEMQDEIEHRES